MSTDGLSTRASTGEHQKSALVELNATIPSKDNSFDISGALISFYFIFTNSYAKLKKAPRISRGKFRAMSINTKEGQLSRMYIYHGILSEHDYDPENN